MRDWKAEAMEYADVDKAAQRRIESTCARCGGGWPELPAGHAGGTGYGEDAAGNRYCYACCAERDRETMDKAEGPFTAYLSSDGRHVTCWPGGELARVVMERESRTGFHGSKVTRVRAVDRKGRAWYGQGAGRGMCLTLRPCKA